MKTYVAYVKPHILNHLKKGKLLPPINSGGIYESISK